MKAVLWLRLLYCLSILIFTVNAACTWTERSSTQYSGNDGSGNAGGTSPDDCKAACVDDCVGVYYDPVPPSFLRCKTFTAHPSADEFDTGGYTSSYFEKSCVDGTTAAPTTSASDSNSNSNSCTMTLADTISESQPSLEWEVKASALTCRGVCAAVSECVAATYSCSAGSCQLYTTSTAPATSSASGFTHYTKKACGNETNCCFDTSDNTQATQSGSVTVTLQNAEQACEAFCLGTSSCKALALSGSTCKLFAQLPSTSQSGFSYKSKTCSGSDPSNLTMTAACKSPQALHVSTLLVLLCLLAAMM